MVPSYVITDTHKQAMKRYNVPGECRIVISDWPYDCDAKRDHPDHVVFVCETHGSWWHVPDWQSADVPDWFGTCADCGEAAADPSTDNGETCLSCAEKRKERALEGDLFNYETAREG